MVTALPAGGRTKARHASNPGQWHVKAHYVELVSGDLQAQHKGQSLGTHETPRPADAAPRMFAGALDAIIPFMLLALIPVHMWVAPDLRHTADEGTVQIWSLSMWAGYYALYSVLSHWRWRRTLGKHIFGLSIVNTDGSRCARATLFGREFFRGGSLGVLSAPWVLELPFYDDVDLWAGPGALISPFAVLLAAVAAAVILCSMLSTKRAPHDHAADTVVVGDIHEQAARAARSPQRDLQALMAVIIVVPLSLLAAVLSSNWLIFLGILIVPVVGLAVVRALYERSRR